MSKDVEVDVVEDVVAQIRQNYSIPHTFVWGIQNISDKQKACNHDIRENIQKNNSSH